MGRTWRWLLAVTLPLVLASCTRSGSETGTGSGMTTQAMRRLPTSGHQARVGLAGAGRAGQRHAVGIRAPSLLYANRITTPLQPRAVGRMRAAPRAASPLRKKPGAGGKDAHLLSGM